MQINTKVKEKLVELNIFNETKKSWQEIPLFEDTLKSLVNKPEINVEVLLMYLTMSSRLRFLKEFQEDGSKFQLLQNEVKETLSDLISASKEDNQTKQLLNNDFSLKFPNKVSDSSALSIRQLVSYPLKGSTVIPPITNKPINFEYSDLDGAIPFLKPIESAAERSATASPCFNQLGNGRKTPTSRLAQDTKKKKEIIEKNEVPYKDQLLKELTFNKKPSFRIGSNVDSISNREKPKGKRIKRSVFHDQAYKGFDLSTQESEITNNSGIKTKSFTSDEKLLKVEAESIKLKFNALVLNGRQLSQEEDDEKEYFNFKIPSEVKNSLTLNKQEISDISKLPDFISQRSNPVELYKKIKPLTDGTILPLKNVVTSQLAESNPSSKPNEGNNKALSIIKTNDDLKKGETPTLEELKQVKPLKSNLPESLKNYDILNIEYRPHLLLAKTYSKKGLADRVYAELMDLNSEIKKTITTYVASIPPSKIESQPEPQESVDIDILKRPLKPSFKQAIKSRRSTSTDNSSSYRKASRNLYYKFCKDLKGPSETDLSTTRGSVPQIKNTIVQKGILARIQNSKPVQKIFVLPKLGLVESSKNANETREIESISLHFNSNAQSIINNKESNSNQIINGRRLASKKTQENEIEEQKGLLSASSSNQQFNIHTAHRASTNHDVSFENLPEEMNNSAIEFENSYEPKIVSQKSNTEDSLTYDSFRKKFKYIGTAVIKKKHFADLSNRQNKFNLEFRKSCIATPDNLIKVSPSRLILHEDYS